MMQTDYNRAEEYITLREELLQLQNFARQVLYWTVILVITGLAWYLSKPADERIPPPIFAVSIYVFLWLSYSTYIIHFNQIYRIGGFLAVFWESSDNDRRLKWHRFNRRGPVGGYLPDVALLVYALTTMMVVVFIGYFTFIQAPQQFAVANGVLMVMGFGFVTVFTELTQYLRIQRDRYEREWRLIRASQERQGEIHDSYETIPPGVVATRGILSPRTMLLLSLLVIAVLGILAFVALKPILHPPTAVIPSPFERRLERLENELDDLKQTSEQHAQTLANQKMQLDISEEIITQLKQRIERLEQRLQSLAKRPAKKRDRL
ncbi:MAG: hypothetical protein G01um101429_1126 [Parcubacteria group bacterium Gr01-1014_29]|nr:MAG: hypothetical protein G01um101429_1126 [Parcubacteria group bacterium Gr01-1014_29]